MPITVDKTVHLPSGEAATLERLALQTGQSEDSLIREALSMLFQQRGTESADALRSDWNSAGAESLNRVWENDADAIYDDWKALYDIQQG